jgi:hypothetical protein
VPFRGGPRGADSQPPLGRSRFAQARVGHRVADIVLMTAKGAHARPAAGRVVEERQVADLFRRPQVRQGQDGEFRPHCRRARPALCFPECPEQVPDACVPFKDQRDDVFFPAGLLFGHPNVSIRAASGSQGRRG